MTLGGFGYVRSLRPLLTFSDLELYRVSFLQALVALRGDCAVVNKYIRAIRAPDEPISLSVIEPLYGSFQTFHVPPAFCTSLLGGPRTCPRSTTADKMHFGTPEVGCQAIVGPKL